ncbi:MAG: hypothetical protein KC416_01670 [Myxococcales bacterium]|nr:hypothetical protein [Myxococcales bacterium]
MCRFVPWLLTIIILAIGPAQALAQDPVAPVPETEGPTDTATTEAPATADAATAEAGTGPNEQGPTVEEVKLKDEQILYEEKAGVEAKEITTDPTEDPDEDYLFLGALFKVWVIPSFFMELFLDRADSIVNPAVGLEFTYRSDGFSVVTSLFWTGLAFESPVQAPGDPITDTEIVDSGLSGITAAATFLWSTEFNKYFALEYGLGIGVTYLAFGDMYRTEAYPDAKSSTGWRKCNGVGDPSTVNGAPLSDGYCDGPPVGDADRGAHYNVKSKNWFDGGKVPVLLPWFALPQIGIRIKPIRQLQIRVDASVGIGVVLGGSVAYGF